MGKSAVIGKNVWLFVDAGGPNLIPIECLTSHTISASQEISNTITKCGRSKTPQGDPDYTISGEGEIRLYTNPTTGAAYSAAELFGLLQVGALVTVVSAPSAQPAYNEGDVIYTGRGYISEWEITYPAEENSTFTFTFDLETLVQEITPFVS